MIFFINKKLIKVILFLFLINVSTSYAGLEDEMENMFGSYVNVTPGTVFNTQSRGGFAAGSVFVRNRISNAKLVSFEPPSFKAGCNGIDLFGGSFSFINKEQAINFARNVASNAMGYAFELALKSLCPECHQIMAQLKAEVEQWNKYLANSCNAAKAIVDASVGPTIDKSMTSVHNSIAARMVSSGQATDTAASGQNGAGEKSPTQIASEAGELQNEQINVVWDALDKSKVLEWFASGTNANREQFKEVIMSMSGTITLTISPSDNTKLVPNEYPGTLQLMDIITASKDKPLKIYACQDKSPGDKCLNILPDQNLAFNFSLKDRVTQTLGLTGTGGILDKMTSTDDNQKFTDAEKSFIESMPQPILAQLRYLSASKGAASLYASYMSDTIVAMLSRQLLEEILNATLQAMQSSTTEMSANMRKNIFIQQEKLNAATQIANANLEQLQRSVDVYDSFRKNIISQKSKSASAYGS